MSVSEIRPAHMSSIRVPVLTPLYGAHQESFCANADGTYRCGSGAASQFRVEFSGAEVAHCCFIRKVGTFSVKCIDGRVWVNDLPVNGVNQLAEGDVISLGSVSYRLEFQDAPSYLPEPDDRPSQMTAQSHELLLTLEKLAEQERENARRSLEMDTHRQELADLQRQLAAAADQNSRTLAAIELAQSELSRREAELLPLREQILAAQAELLNRESLQLVRESGFRQQCDEHALREASLSQRSLELVTKAETLTLLEAALSDRARALAESEQHSTVAASLDADTRSMEQLAAIEAKREELDLREAEIVTAEARLAETRRSTDSIVQAAESERTALLSAKKDLLSERNALSLVRQDLVTRESGIAEREVLVARQLEDLQQAHLSIEERCQSLKLSESNLRQASVELELMRAELAESIRKREELSAKLAEYSLSANSVSLVKQAGADHFPATDLRSELAELFGLQKPAAESLTPPLPSSTFVDLSEPSGENQSVVFHLGSDAAQLAATESMSAVVGDAEPAREEASDDVVRDYMEQLLSRNRRSGGAALSGEPKAAAGKKVPAAASSGKVSGGPTPKSPPKVKSYIEHYMAGNMDNREPMTMSEPNPGAEGVATFDEVRPVQLRPKVDLLQLRENMVSLRALSRQSTENALASHAFGVQRLGFSRRTIFAALLILSTVALGIANVYGVIDAPMLIWVTLISVIAVFSELYRQYRAIAVRARNPLNLLFPSAMANGHILRSTRLTASTSVLADSASHRDVSLNDVGTGAFSTFGHSESQLAETLVSQSSCLDH